jgi:hypothetical protein
MRNNDKPIYKALMLHVMNQKNPKQSAYIISSILYVRKRKETAKKNSYNPCSQSNIKKTIKIKP